MFFFFFQICGGLNLSIKFKNLFFLISRYSKTSSKYLSGNSATRYYINPCLEAKLEGDHIYTIFPFINGIKLSKIKNVILSDNTFNKDQYMFIVKSIIRQLLHGMGVIHKSNIVHQNLNMDTILISINNDIDIKVKFTDFGLGCGTYKTNPKSEHFYQKCLSNDYNSYKIKKNDINNLNNSRLFKKAKDIDTNMITFICLSLLFPYIYITNNKK